MINLKCRRFDIFLANMTQFGIEPHYVICVSNWKNNIKATSINAIIISSKIKNHPSHVNIIGFGLSLPSQIKCEKILTLEKCDLIKKVGKIDDIKIQIEIEKCLSQQLQLDNKYNNFDALDLENLFIENNNFEVDKAKLEKLKAEIYAYYYKKEYKEAIITAYRLKEFAKTTRIQSKNDYLWYFGYMKSLSNLKLGNIEEALLDVQECLTYINRPSGFDRNYSLSLWLCGSIYSKKQELAKSVLIFTSLSKYYKNNYESLLRMAVVFNKARILNNKKAMINICNILKNVEYTNRSIYNTLEYKQELIKEMENEISDF